MRAPSAIRVLMRVKEESLVTPVDLITPVEKTAMNHLSVRKYTVTNWCAFVYVGGCVDVCIFHVH